VTSHQRVTIFKYEYIKALQFQSFTVDQKKILHITNRVLIDKPKLYVFEFTVFHLDTLLQKLMQEICDMYVSNMESCAIHNKSHSPFLHNTKTLLFQFTSLNVTISS
jgi:hypothetical protein